MKNLLTSVVVAGFVGMAGVSGASAYPMQAETASASTSEESAPQQCGAILQHQVQQLRSDQSTDLCQAFHGKVVLFVNTASECGFTPQFEGLEALYQRYKDQGLVIAGFPSDSFNQEFAEADKTAEVCFVNYGVTFPMFSASKVTGEQANPVFKALIAASGTKPKWNFYKYLVGRDEQVIDSYSSFTAPDDDDLIEAIEQALAANTGSAKTTP